MNKKVPSREIILAYFQDPKLGLSTKRVLERLQKEGYSATLKMIQDVLRETEEYKKSRVYKKQTKLFLKLVSNPYSYQGDIFFINHAGKQIPFFACIHLESRIGYVVHLKDRSTSSIIEAFKKILPKLKFPEIIYN